MNETIIHHAKVYLSRDTFCEAVLIRGDTIAATGSNVEILAMAKEAEKIDAKGQLVLPGFNDSHLHLHDFGRNIHRIQAYGVASIDELVARGKELIANMKPPAGSVVIGAGWNEEMFTDEKRHPNRHDIDRISTEHAIIIDRVCGHSVCCNSLALKMAGISGSTPHPEGGHIDMDDKGQPLGILRETAITLVSSIVPPYTVKQLEEQLLYAMKHALSQGLTSVVSRDIIGDNYDAIVDTYLKLFQESKVHLRVNMQCSIEDDPVFDEFIKRGWVSKASMGHPYLTMGSMKLFSDGSLGSRTAYLRKSYNDDPSITGLRVHSPEALDALVQKAHKHKIQVAIHAIGDAGIEQVLNSFETVTSEGNNPCRHAIIHCQITDLPLLKRIAKNDILVMAQPIFLTHDLYMVDDRVGKELASTSYAWNTMEKLGINVSYGTDCPVELMSPIECIDCAVNRQDVTNGYPEGGFYPGECVDVYTAVDNYTKGSAYATFEEDRKGRIKAGQLADLVLLDKDIFTIAKKDIRTAQVLLTMVGGTIAYRK